MKQLFAVIRTRGPAWQHARTLEDQDAWRAHADFMNALLAEGFLVLRGPLEGTADVLLILRSRPLKLSSAWQPILGPRWTFCGSAAWSHGTCGSAPYPRRLGLLTAARETLQYLADAV